MNKTVLWQRYLSYVLNWVLNHFDDNYSGMSPVCYDEWLDNEYQELETIDVTEHADYIIYEFEKLLSKHSMFIPSDDRENDPDEACIYGREYYELEDTVTAALIDICEKIKANPNILIEESGYEA